MLKRFSCAIAFLMLPAMALATAAELVMIAPLNQAMPLAQYDNGKLSGGILKDIGETLAQRLGRSAEFLSVPGDSTAAALTDGRADGLCFVLPHWIDGDFNWTATFMSDAEMVVSRQGATPIRSLSDLKNRSVGTVKAYRYPRIERVLGKRFQRRDTPTTDANLHKLLDGEVDYALLSRSAVEFHNLSDKQHLLRPDLTIAVFEARCAFSKRSETAFSDVEREFNGMLKDGTMQRILARYR
jgi:polar amino acid transport system substrate-binding protein